MAKNYRSASTGRFVTKGTAARHRAPPLPKRNGGSTSGVHRSAITGKFVTKSTATRHEDDDPG